MSWLTNGWTHSDLVHLLTYTYGCAEGHLQEIGHFSRIIELLPFLWQGWFFIALIVIDIFLVQAFPCSKQLAA